MNKVWMITGSNRGLGRAFAEEAVKNGDFEKWRIKENQNKDIS